MRIKISPVGSIEVVIPKRISSLEVDHFVQSNIDWINNTQQKLSALRETTPELDYSPPDTINFVAVDKIFTVHYKSNTDEKSIVEDGRRLAINASNDDERRDILKFWLRQKAKQILTPWISEVAQQHGFQFNRVTIKAQKTRWGSCSAIKNINLNRNLLFVPPELVHYLFVHELSHLIHLNHSAEFWDLVSTFEPGYKQLDMALNRATRDVPLWAMDLN